MSRIFIAALLAVLAVSVAVGNAGFLEVSLVGLGGEIFSLLGTVLFAALVVERAVEVYINNAFDPKKAEIYRGVKIAEQRIAIEEGALDREKKRQADGSSAAGTTKELDDLRLKVTEAREGLLRERKNIIVPLAEYRNSKAAWAGVVATVISLAAAAVGIRILGQFLPTDGNGNLIGPLANTCVSIVTNTENVTKVSDLASAVKVDCQRVDVQLVWFRMVDTLLTTAVLAGGADGIHQIIRRLKSVPSSAE